MEENKFADDLIIRAATNRDCEQILNLVASALGEFGLQPDLDSSEADLKDIEEMYWRAGGFFEVIENEAQEIVGTIGVYPLDAETCKLRKMYLAPELRGKGMGKRLVGRAIAYARRNGYRRVLLETMRAMRAAVNLYTELGFKLVETQPMSPRCELVFVLNLIDERTQTNRKSEL